MVGLVADCSLALAWCLRERDETAAVDVLGKAFGSGIEVPALWSLEFANGVLKAVRLGRMTLPQSDKVFANAAELPVTVDRTTDGRAFNRVFKLANKHGLWIYDAAYLELAIRRDAPLGTLDVKLARAASDEGVLVFPLRVGQREKG